jgi:hypothetical protein
MNAISSLEAELSAIKQELQVTDDDFTRHFGEEKQYLDNLVQPPIIEEVKINYVRALGILDRFQ